MNLSFGVTIMLGYLQNEIGPVERGTGRIVQLQKGKASVTTGRLKDNSTMNKTRDI